ncbi:MAG TPA: hypothetical protein PKK06_07680 [Phycisphaerae bacterium]|nr:hypothetical protein [Phycisphaerae bacterium]HNU47104.1 hypothetical protein [Phycisphaerae bacterium]
MERLSPPPTAAPVDFAQLADVEGRLILLPTVLVNQLLSRGQTSVQLTVELLASAGPRTWLTTTEAAKLHLSDIDNLTLRAALVRVSRAATAGKFIVEGRGHKRRIEPTSFDAWRLAERERNLNRIDDDDV